MPKNRAEIKQKTAQFPGCRKLIIMYYITCIILFQYERAGFYEQEITLLLLWHIYIYKGTHFPETIEMLNIILYI